MLKNEYLDAKIGSDTAVNGTVENRTGARTDGLAFEDLDLWLQELPSLHVPTTPKVDFRSVS